MISGSVALYLEFQVFLLPHHDSDGRSDSSRRPRTPCRLAAGHVDEHVAIVCHAYLVPHCQQSVPHRHPVPSSMICILRKTAEAMSDSMNSPILTASWSLEGQRSVAVDEVEVLLCRLPKAAVRRNGFPGVSGPLYSITIVLL